MAKVTLNLIEEDPNFDSSMLKVGEMMKILDKEIDKKHYGTVGIRVYGNFISLSHPDSTWDISTKILGRKLLSGESVTLTQE